MAMVQDKKRHWEELWRGVDLQNITGERRAVRAAAATNAAAVDWLADGAGDAIPAELRMKIAIAATNLSTSIPFVHQAGEIFDVTGSLVQWQLKGKQLRSGYQGFVVVTTIMTFSPRWANPAWEVLEFPWNKQQAAILAQMRRIALQLDAAPMFSPYPFDAPTS